MMMMMISEMMVSPEDENYFDNASKCFPQSPCSGRSWYCGDDDDEDDLGDDGDLKRRKFKLLFSHSRRALGGLVDPEVNVDPTLQVE